VGLWSTWLLAPVLAYPLRLRVKAVGLSLLLLVGLVLGERLTTFSEEQLYADEMVHATTSPYQRIVLTRGKRGFSLFLNGNLQFSSVDEYRYHEALVHPAMVRAGSVARVLILGGGDGLAAREVLRYPEVQSVTLVDLDPAITGLAASYEELVNLNHHSMTHPKMRVINTDAMKFLEEGDALFDVVIVDFPDPNNFALGKLYTTGFYKLLKRRVAKDGVAVVQSTSPMFARRSFWCVDTTLRAAGFWTEPYHTLVPSFGEWGYVLVAHEATPRRRALPEGLAFLDESTLEGLSRFPPDMGPLPAEVNRLNNQVLVHYYEAEWARWN
jgi:spermidine synthase